jgi:UDP-hydrolysing UDP-N-acetyl-D-glucosamine 2-epimerase
MDVALVTTSRADFGLLYPLICELKQAEGFRVRFIVTGTHLSKLHGYTIDEIRAGGVEVSREIEMTADGDSETAICQAIAAGLIGFSDYFSQFQPDLLIVLGDRYELLSACIASVIHKIPIAHLHGGESTYGLIDDSVRHSVTKMSVFHFTAIEAYARRVIQMGENPEHVYVVGSLGIDNIKNLDLMDALTLSEFSGVDFQKNEVALMTYHPVTLDDYSMAGQQTEEILQVLLTTDLLTLITMPNADTGGETIFRTIESYVTQYPSKFRLIKSLGQRGYLSAMKSARLMIGNSSSGIIESASFKLPVVNIGDRQGGRFKPANVIDCDCTKDSIQNALDKALSQKFAHEISDIENPYGDGNTARRIVNILKTLGPINKTDLIKKRFFDLEFPDPENLKMHGEL